MRISDEERKRLARLEANKLRRRVVQQPKRCVVCREKFTPKRRDAQTCSNICRQQLFRDRH